MAAFNKVQENREAAVQAKQIRQLTANIVEKVVDANMKADPRAESNDLTTHMTNG